MAVDRTLRGDLGQVTRAAQEMFQREPLLLVGVAAGLGFLLGGGVSRQILVAAAGFGARAAANMATNGVLSRVQARAQNGGEDDDSL